MKKQQKNQSEVIAHIMDKFNNYAKQRGIYMVGTPQMCEVAYNHKRSQHMTVLAYAPEKAFIKSLDKRSGSAKKVKGYLVNLGDKRLKFIPLNEITVHQLPEGAEVEKFQRGKKRLQANRKN